MFLLMKMQIIELKIIKKIIEKCPSSVNYNKFSELAFNLFCQSDEFKIWKRNFDFIYKKSLSNFQCYYNELTAKLVSNILPNIQVFF